MAGLLGGMNLRKPNIPANTGGAMAQGLTTGMQMGQNIWENIQRNAQWNMTKDTGQYEYHLGKAYDTNLPLEMRNNHGKTAMKIGEKVLKDNNPNLFDNDNNLIAAKPMMEYRKKIAGLNDELKNKKITFEDYSMALTGNAAELGIDLGSDPVFTAMKEREKENRKEEKDTAAKRGLLGLTPQKFGLTPPDPATGWTPTIKNAQDLNEFNTRQENLMAQPYSTLEKMATAEPKLPLLSKQEESDIAVSEHEKKRKIDIANPIPPAAPTPPKEKEYNSSKDIAVIKMIMSKALPQSSLFQISTEGDIMGMAQSKGDIINAYLNKTPKDKALYNAAMQRLNKHYGISETLETTETTPKNTQGKKIPVFK